MWTALVAWVGLAFTSAATAQSSTFPMSGSHTDVPRWCGKPYMKGSPNFPPGGMLHPPVPSPSPMLDVQVKPRHSIYDSSEAGGDFIVEASISYTHGRPFKNTTSVPGSNETVPFESLVFDIRLADTDQLLVSNVVNLSKPQLFTFDLTRLEPRMKPYPIVLYGSPTHAMGYQNYTATTELYYLPAKNSGSTVKVDNLYGGMLVANNVTNYTFEPLLPFGFYASCSGYLNSSLENVSAYKDLGFNAVNPVCAFPDGDLESLFDWMDELNLWYQYDMRGSFMNLSSVEEQIPLIKDRSAFLSWYTADEPDGHQFALNSTRLVYDFLKEKDPYHPTALVLNCDNYYFEQYSAGADYLMQDAYPVGINPTFSRRWNTTCNETYGDCGCDNCVGELQDISDRLDTFYEYQEWLGDWERPIWSVLQAFSDDGYWARDPTIKETWAMILLSFNHNAKAMMSWLFPSTNTLNEAHGTFSKVATVPPVSSFLMGSEAMNIPVKGDRLLDVSYWMHENKIMVGVVNLDYVDSNRTVSIELPVKVSSVVGQPWGSLSWRLENGTDESTVMICLGLDGLETSIVILDM